MHMKNHIYQERTQIRKARNVLAVEIRESCVEEVLFDLRHIRRKMG